MACKLQIPQRKRLDVSSATPDMRRQECQRAGGALSMWRAFDKPGAISQASRRRCLLRALSLGSTSLVLARAGHGLVARGGTCKITGMAGVQRVAPHRRDSARRHKSLKNMNSV